MCSCKEIGEKERTQCMAAFFKAAYIVQQLVKKFINPTFAWVKRCANWIAKWTTFNTFPNVQLKFDFPQNVVIFPYQLSTNNGINLPNNYYYLLTGILIKCLFILCLLSDNINLITIFRFVNSIWVVRLLINIIIVKTRKINCAPVFPTHYFQLAQKNTDNNDEWQKQIQLI